MVTIVMGTHFLHSVPQSQSNEGPEWQKVDQLCGEVELAAPTEKSMVASGKTEIRLASTPVKNAEVVLYRGTTTDKTCCGSSAPLARTRSSRLGGFELLGFKRGLYWLHVKRGSINATIPIQLTEDFAPQSCHDASVGRFFTVDAQPPNVVTRIY